MNLTLRYSITQFTYWAASTRAASFATIYLLNKGMPSTVVGTLLAISGILSCIRQPFLASASDRAEKFMLKKMLLSISALCMICYGLQLVPQIPLLAAGVIYVTSLCASDACVPLLNALSVAYNQAGYTMNYSAARGVGSVASAVASLVLGSIFARYGALWMMLFLLGFRLLSMILIGSFPNIEKKSGKTKQEEKSFSIPYFFSHYRWYCASLFAIKPVLTPLTSADKIAYKSSNAAVVAVNAKGQVTAKKKGTAVITVKSGTKSVTCKVTVR